MGLTQALQATTSPQEGAVLRGQCGFHPRLSRIQSGIWMWAETKPEHPRETEAKPEIPLTVPKALAKAGSEGLSALSSPPLKGANSL